MKIIPIQLSEDYWDCECENDYIHHNSQSKCELCGAIREEQPRSRIDELKKMDLLK